MSELGLPLVVQVGFAGSRVLFDAKAYPNVVATEFHDAVQQHLTERLGNLVVELGLTPKHFFCGLSQLAIGADTLFTRACRDLHWLQRLFLPQQRDDFLSAVGSDGTPDFNDEQRKRARELFRDTHIVQERVVGDSPDRQTRFHEVNLELIRVSDVVVCLLNAGAVGRPGGTSQMLHDGVRRKRPMLEIRVSVGPDGRPSFEEQWHHRGKFVVPTLPHELSDLHTDLRGVPLAAEYYETLKEFASRMSDLKQSFFRVAALVIIGTHMLATLCAVFALQLHGSDLLRWLLGAELVLLATGFLTHQYLHRSHAVRAWAMTRLVAETVRSCLALKVVPGYLSHLFNLQLPRSLRALLRTLNVIHLRETRSLEPASWSERRDRYIATRLINAPNGQIPYYEERLSRAAWWHKVARRAFLFASSSAMAATGFEFFLALTSGREIAPPEPHISPLGTLAILLPVLAVGALSLAASFDLEARIHTYREMLDFLDLQKEHLHQATSERAFCGLALETESHLVGETASWYSRRSFIGVT